MPREIDVLSERSGYQIIEVSVVAPDGAVQQTWIELIRPSGEHWPCASVEAAEEFIDAEIHPRPPSGPRM